MSISRFARAAAAAGLLLAAHAPAADPPAPPMVTKVYHVADLVVPIPNGPTTPFLKDSPAGPTQPQTIGVNAQLLSKTLATTVRPHTWHGNDLGGAGTIDFYAASSALVVTQTPEVQAEVAKCLQSLRRTTDRQVVVETRVLSVAPDFFVRCGLDCPAAKEAGAPPAGVRMTDAQVRVLLEAAQGDRRVEVLSAPKMTVLHGQTAAVQVGQERMFVTGMDRVEVKGQTVAVPRNTPVFVGLKMECKPDVSADQKFVRLDFGLRRSTVGDTVPLLPVTTMITPVFEGGSQGVPIPFTQFIQQPEVRTSEVSGKFVIPDGGTVMLPAGTDVVETRTECGPVVLSRVPYVNRLFKNVAIGQEERKVVVLLTTRVLDAEAEAKAAKPACVAAQPVAVSCPQAVCEKPAVRPVAFAVAVPPAPETAADLVRMYHAACAAGQHDAAKKLAARALALDPACFSGR